jgi:hypothetical protein
MTIIQPVYPFADVALARRLERAEGLANARCVEARARVSPEMGASWIEVAGALAMFDGPNSPITQTFGLGLFDAVSEADLATVEDFFSARGAPAHHEVSPVAGPPIVTLLTGRGYEPFEFTSVMYRPIGERNLDTPTNPSLQVRAVAASEADLWARTAAEGWRDTAGAGDFMLTIGRIFAVTSGSRLYVAELDGRAIAAAAMHIHEGVAMMAGASTIPAARGRGAQLALLERRLGDAFADGCDIAMMGALPGSVSQRNAERHGFRIAYTRMKWRRR